MTDRLATLVLFARPSERAVAPAPVAPDLIERCRRGDRAALDTVLMEHAGYLERVLVRMVGPRADLEDLLQEVFEGAIGAFPRFRAEASVRTWLHRIAINVAHGYLRRPRHRYDAPLDHEPSSPLPSPDQAASSKQLVARLYEHLDTLDAKKRIAFVLHVLDDRPIAEVAALMKASRAATTSRVFWARRLMIARLARDPAFRRGDP